MNYARPVVGLRTINSGPTFPGDQPNDGGLGNEYTTWKFLREQPGLNIPLVKEMKRFTDPEDPIQFTLISRAPGVELASIWYTLSPEQKSGYRDQLVNVLKQLRQYTSPSPQKINGDKLDDGVLICRTIHPPTCFKIGSTDEEWLEDLSETMRAGISAQYGDSQDEGLVEKKLQEMKDNFPSGAPYTLTHGDLNLTNIIVKDDKIQAIIDWEQSGYCPWWAERYLSKVAGGAYMNELFEGVWEKVQPEISDSAFALIIEKIVPVRKALSRARVWHDHQRHGFLRPPFCKCKPIGGIIRAQFLEPFTHTVADWRNQSEPDTMDWIVNVRDPKVDEKCDQSTPTPKPSPASAPWFATEVPPGKKE
ncbi:hypothetical protein LTR84_007010 [Exophiala bonariae]|uniref:Aminoglycoside phosphotransferase domain-containing protein n=1 Tax=Exophiala bonariae TaxID=1690606 RepID=A0AAV9MZG1_9EURO|nr:hypothetical protein LTR84_007010 [Exophiala bonariae]